MYLECKISWKNKNQTWSENRKRKVFGVFWGVFCCPSYRTKHFRPRNLFAKKVQAFHRTEIKFEDFQQTSDKIDWTSWEYSCFIQYCAHSNSNFYSNPWYLHVIKKMIIGNQFKYLTQLVYMEIWHQSLFVCFKIGSRMIQRISLSFISAYFAKNNHGARS